ncbi:MAG: DHHW family protein [Oscillospiraceae bacterium]
MNKNLEKTKNILVCVVFFAIIIGLLGFSIALPDKDISTAERRKLAKLPEISLQTLLNGQYMGKVDKYTLDQFAARDSFRALKAQVSFNVFRKKDNNKIFVMGDEIYRMEYPLSEKDILSAGDKFNKVYREYLQGMSCYYAIIPDKNYFVAEQNGYLSLDYKKAEQLLTGKITHMEYINLFDVLKKEDYYRTDTHWRQENLQEVVNKLSAQMGFAPADFKSYKMNTLNDFKGVYYGQAALKLPAEQLNYLTNFVTDAATVYNHETKKTTPIYETEKFSQLDPYNLFLTGPSTILEMTNNNADTDKELIIFRDSFGSSIAPMLLESYAKVTLVDLRYIPASKLTEFIEFKNQDVLFLYSTLILNSSAMLRV